MKKLLNKKIVKFLKQKIFWILILSRKLNLELFWMEQIKQKSVFPIMELIIIF